MAFNYTNPYLWPTPWNYNGPLYDYSEPPYAENFYLPWAPVTSGNQNSLYDYSKPPLRREFVSTLGATNIQQPKLLYDRSNPRSIDFVLRLLLDFLLMPYLPTIPTSAPSESSNSSRCRRFSFAPEDPLSLCNMGLDARVVETLPVFEYKAQSFKDALDCAVCLSELEENQKARFLPNCKHSFHVDCIEMWFHSHSTCPICRTGVQPKQWVGNNNTDEISVNVELISSGNRKFLISTGLALGETSSHEARNRSGLTISSMPEAATDMPRRSESFSGKTRRARAVDCSRQKLRPIQCEDNVLQRHGREGIHGCFARSGYRTRGQGQYNGSMLVYMHLD